MDEKKKWLSQIASPTSESRKNERDPAIVIKPVAGRAGEYLAYCRSAYLDATFAVYFRDTLMGGLALHSFIGMVENKYKGQHYLRMKVALTTRHRTAPLP